MNDHLDAMYVENIKKMQEQMQGSIEDSKTTGAKQEDRQEVRSKTDANVGENKASDAVVTGRLDDESSDLNLVSIPGVPE